MKEMLMKYGIPAAAITTGMVAGWFLGRSSGVRAGERKAYKEIAEAQTRFTEMFKEHLTEAEEIMESFAEASPEEIQEERDKSDGEEK